MKNLKIHLCAILLLLLTSFELQSTNEFNSDRIIGGEDATQRIVYQVSLRTELKLHICGGSILNNNWVVTAAHCTISEVKQVYVGSNSLSDVNNVVYNISRMIQHPNYNGATFDNDIGLIKTTTAIIFNANVGSVSLPTRDILLTENLNVTGWGLTSYPDESIPDKLQYLNTNAISAEDCNERTSMTLPTSILCTLKEEGKGNCFGDSGGPNVNNGILYGVSSAIYPCAMGLPDLNVRVFQIVGWIIEIIG